ncbi:MAG: ARMT1-like domain-containing protein [Cytophagales bacterium]|nr:ARMT1-like domain-containing protein [Cytophagales bacterium]
MRHECYFCHLKTVEKLIDKFKPQRKVADLFARAVNELLYHKQDGTNPILAGDIHRLAKDIINNSDLYREEKHQANKVLLENYDVWEDLVKNNGDPMRKATKLAVAGNIIDYGAHSVPTDIEKQIKAMLNIDLAIDETDELFQKIARADSILYLGDNAGEIVFDKLLIETSEHPNITYVVRGRPIINDVTHEDAEQVGMHHVCKVVSNGSDVPSTLLNLCSEKFIRKFYKTDLVISKGQGNYEGLMNADHPNLYFLLIAKCKPIAELLGVDLFGMVVGKGPRLEAGRRW